LGLALVRAVCEAHNGAPSIELQPGRTTVMMTIPQAQPGIPRTHRLTTTTP
jgi:nitrogen-specific signal transduction histidine kinase